MTTNNGGHRPGGGIASKQHVQTPVRTGSGSHSVRPSGTNKFGYSVGDHVTGKASGTGFRGEHLFNPERDAEFGEFGNAIAVRTVCGPGGSRTLHGQAGSQGQHGDVAGSRAPQGRGILTNE